MFTKVTIWFLGLKIWQKMKQAWRSDRRGVLAAVSASIAFLLWMVPIDLKGLAFSSFDCGYMNLDSATVLNLLVVRVDAVCGDFYFDWANYWFQTDRIPAALCFLAIAAYLFWQRSVAQNTNRRSRRSGMTLLLPDSLTREQVATALGALVLVAFISYSVGHSAGYDAGYNYGYDTGEEAGYAKGYEEGYSKGEDDGAKQGYSGGYEDGYSEGSSDGYNEGRTGGCEWVFEQSGYYSYVIAYDPYNSSNRYPGRYYVSKLNCP